MTSPEYEATQKKILSVFKMPSVQTMVSRKSSITNAFVNAIIPVVPPSPAEISDTLRILELDADDLRCAYCGDPASEWDHLRPLVVNRRPTGYISEIANLVPSCGKCNQSKGNKSWRVWMRSEARLSPTGRKIPETENRIARLEKYEESRLPTHVDFEAILGHDVWENYWQLCDRVIGELKTCQVVADDLRNQIGMQFRA